MNMRMTITQTYRKWRAQCTGPANGDIENFRKKCSTMDAFKYPRLWHRCCSRLWTFAREMRMLAHGIYRLMLPPLLICAPFRAGCSRGSFKLMSALPMACA